MAPPRTFDGLVGRENAKRLVASFLDKVLKGDIEPIGDTAQAIHHATPGGNPNGPIPSDYFEAPWRWLTAVSERSARDGDYVLPAQIALMTEIWKRNILAEDPGYQMGRLSRPPLKLEETIYTIALTNVTKLQPADVVVPGHGGWTASDVVNLLSERVEWMIEAGEQVDPQLVSLARGGARFTTPDPKPQYVVSFEKAHDIVQQNLDSAEGGDDASLAWLAGCAILNTPGGDPREALMHLEQAARLGHVQAMYDAGTEAHKLGEHDLALFWWRTGSDAGSSNCAFNLGVALRNNHQFEESMASFERCGELGDPEAYAELAKMAKLVFEDDAASARWLRIGADANEPWCLMQHGMRVFQGANGDVATLRQARDYFERSADAGQPIAIGMAANTNSMLGDHARCQRYVDMAVRSGDSQVIDMLRRNGFLDSYPPRG